MMQSRIEELQEKEVAKELQKLYIEGKLSREEIEQEGARLPLKLKGYIATAVLVREVREKIGDTTENPQINISYLTELQHRLAKKAETEELRSLFQRFSARISRILAGKKGCSSGGKGR